MSVANQISEPGRKLAAQLQAPAVNLMAHIAARTKRKADDDDAEASGCAVPCPTKPPSDREGAKAEIEAVPACTGQ